MLSRKPKLSVTDMTSAQFREWCLLIMNEALFNDRDKLVTLLAQNTDRGLTEGFRAFFEAYSYDLAFDLDVQEGAVLTALEARKELAHLRQRVAAVEGKRKISQKGREARRVGMSVIGDPLPEIKVTAL